VSRPTVSVPLPESAESKAPELGWRVTYGRKIGQRTIEAGVVLAFEPDTTLASAAFEKKCLEYMANVDSRVNVPGTLVSMEARTGKYVAANWGPRER